MPPEHALFLALCLVVFVGSLQLILDARARRRPFEGLDLYLHVETTGFGPAVIDQTGRRLRGIKVMRYTSRLDEVDRLYLEVLAHDGQGYLLAGRRATPTSSRERKR